MVARNGLVCKIKQLMVGQTVYNIERGYIFWHAKISSDKMCVLKMTLPTNRAVGNTFVVVVF